MKKSIYLLSFLFVFTLNSQKNKNGSVYDKHPAIETVNSFNQAWVSGDIEKASSFLTEDFRVRNGNSVNKEDEGANKQQMINNMNWWYNNNSYLKFTQDLPAYPDAIEYKNGDQIWVQTWDRLYAVNNQTGVKFDDPIHRLYMLTNDSKQIRLIFQYNNQNTFRKRNDAWPGNDMKNGVIYMNHENINSVRKLQYAYAHGDDEKAMSFFHENASFNDINEAEVMNSEEILARDSKMFEGWDIESLDEVGYPDYFEYDWRESKVVASWWRFTMVRKSDGKKVKIPVHFSDRFDNDGKIVWRTSYWNKSLLD